MWGVAKSESNLLTRSGFDVPYGACLKPPI